MTRTESRARTLAEDRQNRRYLNGVEFPTPLTVHFDSASAISYAEFVIIAVPSTSMRSTIEFHGPNISDDATIISATKGLEIETGMRMSEVITEIISKKQGSDADAVDERVCALSGPNLAVEIASGLPALATAASSSIDAAESVQLLLSSERFRVYTSTDIIGVELGGTLKNIIGIGAGFIDGSSLGANIKAAYVTRGLHEITRLGLAMGANATTFAGLSGAGDMLATCYSSLSRNYRLGYKLAEGKSLTDALSEIGQTAEGVPTTQAAFQLARRLNVEMPLTETAHRVLFEGVPPFEAITALMTRELQREELL